jgi:hypothetical protein
MEEYEAHLNSPALQIRNSYHLMLIGKREN